MFRTYIECNNNKNNQKYSYKKSFSTFREELNSKLMAIRQIMKSFIRQKRINYK